MSEETEKEIEESEDTGTGDKPKTPQAVIDANAAAERMEKANAKREELVERDEDLATQRALGGGSEGGKEAEKPKKLTDTEYAEALERGEVNPLKEDGLI